MTKPDDRIECTYGDILDAKESLGRLANADLPTRVAYHVGRVLKYASDASKEYDLKRRALIRKYGEARPATFQELINGAKKVVHDVTDVEKAAAYNEEVEPIRDEKIVLPWRPIPADSLPATMTPGDAALLLPFLSGELPPLGEEPK